MIAICIHPDLRDTFPRVCTNVMLHVRLSILKHLIRTWPGDLNPCKIPTIAYWYLLPQSAVATPSLCYRYIASSLSERQWSRTTCCLRLRGVHAMPKPIPDEFTWLIPRALEADIWTASVPHLCQPECHLGLHICFPSESYIWTTHRPQSWIICCQ